LDWKALGVENNFIVQITEVEFKLEWDKINIIFNSIVTVLEYYEAKYNMSSEDFYGKFNSGEINEEREEFYAWRTKYSAYKHMNRRFGLTR